MPLWALAARDAAIGVTRAEDRLHALGGIRARRLRRVRAHVDEGGGRRKIGGLHAALGLRILGETAGAVALVGFSPGDRRKGIRDEIVDGADAGYRDQRRAGAVELSGNLAGTGDGTVAGFGGVYCSMITGVAIPNVGNFLSLAITPLTSSESGSSC